MAYKWETPYAWLRDYIEDLDAGMLRQMVMDIALRVDPDGIQDLFQDEMEEDGYFEEEE